MRYRLVVILLLMLLVVTPVIYLPAAPAPEPAHGILDIGPPPKDKTQEEYARDVIGWLVAPRGLIWYVQSDREVRNLASVVRLKDAGPWLVENIRVTSESGGRRPRVTFRAGTRAERVAIINALLRSYIRQHREYGIKYLEETLRMYEDRVPELKARIESGMFLRSADIYRKEINDLLTDKIPDIRDKIDRLKPVTVIKWAK